MLLDSYMRTLIALSTERTPVHYLSAFIVVIYMLTYISTHVLKVMCFVFLMVVCLDCITWFVRRGAHQQSGAGDVESLTHVNPVDRDTSDETANETSFASMDFHALYNEWSETHHKLDDILSHQDADSAHNRLCYDNANEYLKCILAELHRRDSMPTVSGIPADNSAA